MKKVNLKIISSIPPHGFSRRIIVLIAASVPNVWYEKKNSQFYHRYVWGLVPMMGMQILPFWLKEILSLKCCKKLILKLGSCMYKFSIHRDRFGLLRLTIYQCYFFSYPTLLHVTNLDK